MNKLLVCLALIFPILAGSQITDYSYPMYDVYDDMSYHYFNLSDYLGEINFKERQNVMLNKKVKSIEISGTHYGKKQKLEPYQTTTEFNALGRLTKLTSKNTTRKFEYQNDTLPIYIFEQYKKNIKETKIAYENGKRVKQENFRNSKLTQSREYVYNAAGKISVSKWKFKRNYGEMRYSYNAQNKMTRSEQYRKGKLKNVWVYECKPEGQDLASAKNEILSSTCSYNEESADGSYIVFKRDIKYGKPYLLKRHYSKDSVLFLSEYFENDSILTSSNRYNPETKTWTNNRFYKKKLVGQDIVKYDDNKKLIFYEVYGGRKMKLRYYTKNEFDSNGRLTTEIHGSGKNISYIRKEVHVYNELGLIISTKTYENDKLASEQTIDYKYYQ